MPRVQEERSSRILQGISYCKQLFVNRAVLGIGTVLIIVGLGGYMMYAQALSSRLASQTTPHTILPTKPGTALAGATSTTPTVASTPPSSSSSPKVTPTPTPSVASAPTTGMTTAPPQTVVSGASSACDQNLLQQAQKTYDQQKAKEDDAYKKNIALQLIQQLRDKLTDQHQITLDNLEYQLQAALMQAHCL